MQNKDNFFFYCCHRVICQLTAESLSVGCLQFWWFPSLSRGPDKYSRFWYSLIDFQLVDEFTVFLLVHKAIQRI